MSEQMDYSSLMQALQAKLAEKASGMMFISPQNGRPIVMAIKEGVVCSIYSSTSKGKATLTQLAEVEQASYQFNATAAPMILPGTEITPEEVSDALGISSAVVTATATTSSPQDTTRDASSDFHAQALALIKERLIDIMGPFASVILQDALCSSSSSHFNSVDDTEDLLEKLADEMDDKQEALQFSRQIKSALEKL